MVTLHSIVGKLLILFLLSVPVFASEPASPPPIGTLIDVGGYRVHLYCTGTGSPTVLVVGGAFSFDWGLVQPEVARFTRVCTYDPSGTAWSDPYPAVRNDVSAAPHCVDRVAEIRQLVINAHLPAPCVLVGFSIGGLFARLYANDYPEDVAGLVIVDHAFVDLPSAGGGESVASAAPLPRSRGNPALAAPIDSPPVLLSSKPIVLGLEDDRNFAKLPQRNQDLHAWAMSKLPLRPTAEMAAECFGLVSRTAHQTFPLGEKPVVVIRTGNDLSAYERLQADLMLLSHQSKQVLAGRSSHMVIIDQPELVVRSIQDVVNAINDPLNSRRQESQK